jgi:hypothetical protein
MDDCILSQHIGQETSWCREVLPGHPSAKAAVLSPRHRDSPQAWKCTCVHALMFRATLYAVKICLGAGCDALESIRLEWCCPLMSFAEQESNRRATKVIAIMG